MASSWQRRSRTANARGALLDARTVERERPSHCARDAAKTMLARIEPVETGYELRTFECPSCDNIRTVKASVDAKY